MKFTTPILVLSLTASVAMAQSVMAPINKAREAAAASSARTAESAKVLDAQQNPATPVKAAAAATTSVPAKAAVPAKTAPAKPAAGANKAVKTTPAATPFGPKTAAKPATKAPAAQSEATEVAAAPAPEMKKTISERGKRDPFLSIIRTDKVAGEPCLSGKKCLVIGDVILRGVVKSSNAVIAVVENAQHKTYFLHEDDPVFNGQVVKITPDSVVFREHVTDRAGHPSTREITKRLNARPIA